MGTNLSGSTERVNRAFSHEKPDRTPLFEIFQPFHPIYWDICGRNVATDMAMAWDAMADGIAWEELIDAQIKAQYAICRFFGLDMVRLNPAIPKDYVQPVKIKENHWTLDGVAYSLNERTRLVDLDNPSQDMSDSARVSEDDARLRIEQWDGSAPQLPTEPDAVLKGVQALAARDGLDWVFMGEVGCGTAVAFHPPFMLMWIIAEPQLYRRYLEMQKAVGLALTRQAIESGCTVIAMGGDVSCDKGPFISPTHYREFILPVIQEHVQFIHEMGARAVYTSDGNHWPIKDDFFFNSGIDGYKEVDYAAGMTFERLIDEGVAERVCIIGNMDARHLMCHGSVEQVKQATRKCLELGGQTPGGHILHLSHSVHEDVKAANYYAIVDAYREFFGCAG